MVGYLTRRAWRPANPDPQSGVLSRAQTLLDRFQTAVSAATALPSEPDFAERQVRIVHDRQQAFKRYPEVCHQFADRLTGLVHVRLRLAEHQLATVMLYLGQSRHELVVPGPLCPPASSQPFNNHETRVMSRPGILCSRISQAHNQITVLHARACSIDRARKTTIRLKAATFFSRVSSRLSRPSRLSPQAFRTASRRLFGPAWPRLRRRLALHPLPSSL